MVCWSLYKTKQTNIYFPNTWPSLFTIPEIVQVWVGTRVQGLIHLVFYHHFQQNMKDSSLTFFLLYRSPGGGGLPYMSYMGMCRCEGYGFQRVYSRIGCRNQRVLVLVFYMAVSQKDWKQSNSRT